MSKPNDDYVYGFPAHPPYVHLENAPVERNRPRCSCWSLWSACRVLTAAVLLSSLIGIGFAVYPKQPVVDVRKVTLQDISLHMDDGKSIIPSVTLDLSLSLLLKITNMNFFGVDYDRVTVHFSYRGDELGQVQSQGGRVPARSVALVAALLDLKGTQVLKHISELIVDVANNEVPIETRTVFSGVVQILMFRPHIEVGVHCKMLVNPKTKEILDRDCSLF